jgi:hypothetical protein
MAIEIWTFFKEISDRVVPTENNEFNTEQQVVSVVPTDLLCQVDKGLGYTSSLCC